MRKKDTLFLKYSSGEDSLYSWIRDNPRAATDRKQLEIYWNEYKEYAPKGFKRKLQFEFHQRWWEMYMTIGLLHLGFVIKTSPRDKGPDLLLETKEGRVWIEAVAPREGTKSDRVPELRINGVAEFPRRECLLRLAQGVTEKRKTLADYISRGTIPIDEPCVIALSSAGLNQHGSLLEGLNPAPLAIIAGVGFPVITINGSKEPYSSYEKTILRDSGNPVDSVMFEKEDFKIISAILYSSCDPLNASSLPEKSFSLFLNPKAIHAAPRSLYSRIETWVAEREEAKVVWIKRQPDVT